MKNTSVNPVNKPAGESVKKTPKTPKTPKSLGKSPKSPNSAKSPSFDTPRSSFNVNFKNPKYGHMIDDWANGKYYKLTFHQDPNSLEGITFKQSFIPK